MGQENLVTNSHHHVHFRCYFRSVEEQVEAQGLVGNYHVITKFMNVRKFKTIFV